MAAVLAVATVLAAGLTVLPNSVREAQANPCANEVNTNVEANGGDGATLDTSTSTSITSNDDTDERECNFNGNLEDAFDED